MKKWILKFYENDVIRYIFWGWLYDSRKSVKLFIS